MKRLPVRSDLWAMSLPVRPTSAQAWQTPTSTSGSRLVGQAGLMQVSYAFWRKGWTLIRGAPQSGQTAASPSRASMRPCGSG